MQENNLTRFSGFADTYDAYRPQPPVVIVDILTQLTGVSKAKLVVDIGCGTGLSTRIWAGRAERVIGVEPNADMRAQAQKSTTAPEITYRDGTSTSTGLDGASADIVTASQSFHWMEPEPTLAEVARILCPGGVFATIDCDWPPTINREAEEAYTAFTRRTHELERQLGVAESTSRWSKNEHLTRIQESGHFGYTKEILVHNVEQGSADRLCGLALSFGGVAALVKMGVSEDELGLTTLRATAVRAIGDTPVPWYFSYRIRMGIK